MKAIVRKLSTAERIVWVFEELVTEAHRGSIQLTLTIDADEFEASIGRARDLGVDKGLRITAVYERDGWWTCEPTQRIAAISEHETLKRQHGEAVRNARVYAGFGDLDGFTKWHSAATRGTLDAYIDGLKEVEEVGPAADYVLSRIDASAHWYVPRDGVAP